MQWLKKTSSDDVPKKKTRTSEEKNRKDARLKMQKCVLYALLVIFAFNTLGVMLLVYFCGLGLMALSQTIILTLIGETIAYGGAMFYMVAKQLFSSQ